jgi:hypothetical protein
MALADCRFDAGCLDRATAAETEPGVSELVENATTPADQQKLVEWYEQREDEVRHQAEVYRRLAQVYGEHRTVTATACEEIARYYHEIATQLEKLLNNTDIWQHRVRSYPCCESDISVF